MAWKRKNEKKYCEQSKKKKKSEKKLGSQHFLFPRLEQARPGVNYAGHALYAKSFFFHQFVSKITDLCCNLISMSVI